MIKFLVSIALFGSASCSPLQDETADVADRVDGVGFCKRDYSSCLEFDFQAQTFTEDDVVGAYGECTLNGATEPECYSFPIPMYLTGMRGARTGEWCVDDACFQIYEQAGEVGGVEYSYYIFGENNFNSSDVYYKDDGRISVISYRGDFYYPQ